MDWINILAGVLGFLIASLWKMQSLQKLARKANVPFVYKNYFRDDALGIISSFLSIPLWQILFPEIANVYPKLEMFIRFSFVVMGACGSFLLQRALGKTQSWLAAKIDKATDELKEMKQAQKENEN